MDFRVPLQVIKMLNRNTSRKMCYLCAITVDISLSVVFLMCERHCQKVSYRENYFSPL